MSAQTAQDQSQPAQNITAGEIPKTWPGAFGLYKYAKVTTLVNVWIIVGLYFLSYFVSLALGLVLGKNFGQALGNLTSIFFSLAATYAYLDSTYGRKADFGELLKRSLDIKVLAKFFVVSIFVGFALAFSFLLFIIPFFFVLPRVILAPYYLLDKNLDIGNAIELAWKQSKPHQSKIWGVIGVTLLIGLLFFTIIGIPFAIYFGLLYSSALTIVYRFVTGNSSQPAVPAPTTTN